ncbi:cation transporter [Xanthomonas campestris pv. raphani]|uniref:cation transporter n=1 Tax=Xanthomonas campestris TaxID=339 RepID=UPI000E326C9A|nr:cation transporter [Xanthomonas campestris]MCC8486449.1 cation diffusion facilitator family transporter [Xanthomonas campestris]MEA9652464.1 cation transporter [Xanthomonas campestris pv. raphani]MEA9744952.1 cation transporter [Xanthomonas campestris pv. raphani]MEA9749299.1 cation transporter [Xanthomonas campestris pv. raphani]MEA9761124.1 cation transporter [Xanthomonas campestris pv. raphani]
MSAPCCGCGKTLDVAAMHARQRRVLWWVLAINAGSFALMLAGALHSGAASLLSGSLDNLGDALTYALSLAVVGASMAAKARVALLKAGLILLAALAVAAEIGWKLAHPQVPLFQSMSVVAAANFLANLVCLRLLWPYRDGDINLASAWACSRNDVYEGVAVLAASGAVWALGSGWPDLLIAVGLLVVFLRSAWQVARRAWAELGTAG